MPKLLKSDVLHVGKLAKLNLKDSEIDMFLPQLSLIISHISELSAVDTGDVNPTSQTTGLENVFRPDEAVSSSLDQSKALSGTDSFHNGYFKVDAILTERSDK